jgi:hypothetical protein
MKQLIKNARQVLMLLLVISMTGCDEDTVALPQISAGFTHTIDQETRTVTFINTSENADSYTWSFGDQEATTSNLNNPIFTYAVGAYTIVLTATNVAGDSDTFQDTIIFLDQDIPLITLLGSETINVTLGDSFTDPGATALDEVDGDITANIVVGGDTVDTNVEDTYTITYDVTDAQGNEAIQVVRTVIVSAISCVAETEGSLSASNLNLTFMSDPTASVINDGADFSWIDNPDFDNTENASCKVGQITKLGNNPWDNTQIDLDAKLDFNANTGLKIKVWSSVANTEVRIKLEEIGNAGNNVEQFLTTSVTSGWEELTFPFTAADSNKFDKIVMFFDLNANNTDTYYFDDLMLYGTGNGGGTTCTAETSESMSASDLNVTFMSDQTANIVNDNATFEYVANPDFDNAINSSCFVGKVTKSNVNPWDNNQIDLDAKLDFNNNSGIKMKVYSSNPGYTVLLKLESQANPGINTEIDLTTTQTNAWEELTYPFASSESDKYDRIVLIFDLATANTNTYYFDDLKLYGTGGGGGGGGAYTLDQAIDFEPAGFGAAWAWNVFENVSNPPLEFIANPVSGGINTSATVAKITALQGGQPWVGTETQHGQMGITWDLDSSNAIIKIMVYKTVISDVGIKLVNPTGGAQVEIKVANTLINQWEELAFDFTSRIGNGLDGSTNIDQIVVFPDFDLGGRTQDNVVYFDNITFN